MNHPEVPVERLQSFQERLGLDAEDLAVLDPYQEIFLAQRDAFAEYLHGVLNSIPETRRIVELMEGRGGLRRNWRCWYQGLFTQHFNAQFYEFLWSSGIQHLSRNVDQRFIHLGYCMGRLFLSRIIDDEIPLEARARVRRVVDKMLDQCLMVATDAFLTGTTRCDREVINGIAHQVRNPLTVIGGFIHSARRKIAADNPAHPMLETMLQETRRLEGMVENVGAYIELMQRDPAFDLCALGPVLDRVRTRLRAEGWIAEVEVERNDALDHLLESDASLLELLFYHLLRNALEAASQATTPEVQVTGFLVGEPPASVTVQVENNGRTPNPEELQHLFAPFYSSNPAGSGFGLPIAALIVRKTQGEIDMATVPGEGTRVTVSLPIRQR